MSILDTDIERTDALLKCKSRDRVMEWLASSLSFENFAVLTKKNVIIPDYSNCTDLPPDVRPRRGIFARQNTSKIHFIDGVAYSFVDLIWDEDTARWIITPKDPSRPVFLIIHEPDLIPEDIYFPNETLIYPKITCNGLHDGFFHDPRFKFVNPYRTLNGQYGYVDYLESLGM